MDTFKIDRGCINEISFSLTFLLFATFIILVIYSKKIFAYLNVDVTGRFFMVILAFGGGCIALFYPTIIPMAREVNPYSLFSLLIPIRVFTMVYDMDGQLFLKCILPLIIMNTFCFVVFVLTFGYIMSVLIYGYNDWIFTIAYGLSLASFDTPAMYKVVKGLDNTQLSRTLMTAESITILANSCVLLDIYLAWVEGVVSDLHHLIFTYTRFVGLGLLCGYACGKLSETLMGRITNKFQYSILIIVLFVYMQYIVCEYVFYCSGVFCTFVFSVRVCSEKGQISQKADRLFRLSLDVMHLTISSLCCLRVYGYAFIRTVQFFELRTIFHSICTFFIITIIRGFCILPVVFYITKKFGRNMYTIISLVMVRRDIFELLKVLIVYHSKETSEQFSYPISFTLIMIAAQLIFANLFMKRIYTALRCEIIDLANKTNVANCFFLLASTRDNYLEISKMDKYLADVNWHVVYEALSLESGTIKKTKAEGGDDGQVNRTTRAAKRPSCFECTEIEENISSQDFAEKIRDLKTMVLQTQKISFIRQKERGFMLKKNLKYLLFAIDMAQQAPKRKIDIATLLRPLTKRTIYDNFHDFLVDLIDTRVEVRPPRNRCRRYLYIITYNLIYDIFLYIVILGSIVCFYMILYEWPTTNVALLLVPYAIFVWDIIARILVHWHIDFHDGYRHYLHDAWNLFDLGMLVINTIELWLMFDGYFRVNIFGNIIWLFLVPARNLRLLKLVQIIFEARHVLLRVCNRRIGQRMLLSYGIALSVLISYQEVLHSLQHIPESPHVRRRLESELLGEKWKVLYELCKVQLHMPWVAATAKTRRIVDTSVNTMRESIQVMKQMGFTDEFEYSELLNCIESLHKPIASIRQVSLATPLQFFKSLPFFQTLRGLDDLYEMAELVVFERDMSVLQEDTLSNGIYIIIEGMAVVVYSPDETERMAVNALGALPVREYINDVDFHRMRKHFIIPGNCVGMLSYLTGRPSNSMVRAITKVRALHLDDAALRIAEFSNNDPVHGLRSRMWKYVGVNIALNIMWNMPIYRNLKMEELHYFMEKSFIPNTDGRQMVQIPDCVDDVILIEGKIRDSNTDKMYTAPCYIPRSVRKMELMRKTMLAVEPKLFIVPIQVEMQMNIYHHMEFGRPQMNFKSSSVLRTRSVGMLNFRTRASGI